MTRVPKITLLGYLKLHGKQVIIEQGVKRSKGQVNRKSSLVLPRVDSSSTSNNAQIAYTKLRTLLSLMRTQGLPNS